MRLTESLAEFMSDGGKWQLSRPAEGTWRSVGKRTIRIGQHETVTVEAGITATVQDFHTGVIQVTVKPMKLQNGAEDAAVETVTVYYRDFPTSSEAEAALKRIWQGDVTEETTTLGTQLFQQRPPGTIAI